MTEQNLHKIGFLVAFINELARRFHLTDKESYNYISRYGGMEMFFENYNILHTLAFSDMVEVDYSSWGTAIFPKSRLCV